MADIPITIGGPSADQVADQILAGGTDLPSQPSATSPTPANQELVMVEGGTDVVLGAVGDAAPLPHHWSVLPHVVPSGVSGGGTTWANHSSFPKSEQRYTTTGANGQWMEYDFVVDAGTYRFDLCVRKDVSLGICDVLIDGVSKGTLDLYASATNVIVSLTGIAITRGRHTLRLLANGKNASSSSYYVTHSGISLTRTGS